MIVETWQSMLVVEKVKVSNIKSWGTTLQKEIFVIIECSILIKYGDKKFRPTLAQKNTEDRRTNKIIELWKYSR